MRKAGSTRWVSDAFTATANPELCMPSSRATSNVMVVSTTSGATAHNSGDIWIARDRPSVTFQVTARARTNRLNVAVNLCRYEADDSHPQAAVRT